MADRIDGKEIIIVEQIKKYQQNLIQLLTFRESCNSLGVLITHTAKEVKDYVDEHGGYYSCVILTRELNGKRVLFDVQWVKPEN